MEQWKGFEEGRWTEEINVDDFINRNYHPYDGDESFLKGPTARTEACNQKVNELLEAERKAVGNNIRVLLELGYDISRRQPDYAD